MNASASRAVSPQLPDIDSSEAIIPWAEGNGLWKRMNQLVSSLVGVDVVTFFAWNPHSCDSAAELAVRIGHPSASVEPVLEQLEGAGFLESADLKGVRAYRLVEDPVFRQTLQQYAIWLQEGYHWARIGIEQ